MKPSIRKAAKTSSSVCIMSLWGQGLRGRRPLCVSRRQRREESFLLPMEGPSFVIWIRTWWSVCTNVTFGTVSWNCPFLGGWIICPRCCKILWRQVSRDWPVRPLIPRWTFPWTFSGVNPIMTRPKCCKPVRPVNRPLSCIPSREIPRGFAMCILIRPNCAYSVRVCMEPNALKMEPVRSTSPTCFSETTATSRTPNSNTSTKSP
mmetsp:Transcript_11908/g.21639  ORF Transcript_11908/g.21639 Transcript_11908/m.21639 type:complete len:205 (+) Transcript_11908:605-1219(+)